MNIIEEPVIDYEIISIDVVDAYFVGNYCISISFSDNTTQKVDFYSFLSKNHHPAIVKYLDENLFKQFKIVDGNLNWNNYDLIFPVEDLYNGEIS